MAFASQPAPSPPHLAFSKMEAPLWVSASRNAGLPLSPAPRWTMDFSRGTVRLHFSYLISVLQKLWNRQEQLRSLRSTSYTKYLLNEQKFYHSRQARNTGIPIVLTQLGHRVKFPQQNTRQYCHSKKRGQYLHSQLQGKWQSFGPEVEADLTKRVLEALPKGTDFIWNEGEEVKVWRHYQKQLRLWW